MRALLLCLAFLFVGACEKDPPPPPPKPAQGAKREPSPPPPGTDADLKLNAGIALAKSADEALAAAAPIEKPMPAADGKACKVKVWLDGKRPKKVTVLTLDDGGATTAVTDIYYDERGKPGFVRAPDGLFIFHEESLALWTDHERRVKRGISPEAARERVAEIKKLSSDALGAAGASF
jgi:hypothetical protein